MANLFVLTSKSEGIPIVLMEAMFNGNLVLAPSITGITELISDGETGFLYESGNLNQFVQKIVYIHQQANVLSGIRLRARDKILRDYNRQNNTENFADILLKNNLIAL